MPTTNLQYLTDMFTYSGTATVQAVRTGADGGVVLILDSTLFYPQGGGQAYDTGMIEGPEFTFHVSAVHYVDGEVLHSGLVTRGAPCEGSKVNLSVDVERRLRNSRLQSGGHLLLNAVEISGRALTATKGYHFPDGPYVEFSGTVPEEERESFLSLLQTAVDRLVADDLPVQTAFIESAELQQVCKNVPANVPTDKPTRVVTIDGLSQPCGGTHVSRLGELRGMTVEKVRSKKGNTKISYTMP